MNVPDVFERRIDEHVTPGKRLGRHVKHDPRSRQYQAKLAGAVADVIHPIRATSMPLDQNGQGACTAFAAIGARNCVPNWGGRGAFANKDGFWLYRQEVVTIEGLNPFQDVGGTGIDVCKAALNAKWVKSYTHTFSFNDLLKALTLRPGMIGANWYDSQDTPDQNGVAHITPAAQVRGGHEYLAVQIIASQQLVGCWNSWGPKWGVAPPPEAVMGIDPPPGGFFYLTFSDLERLLSEQGDFTVPVGP